MNGISWCSGRALSFLNYLSCSMNFAYKATFWDSSYRCCFHPRFPLQLSSLPKTHLRFRSLLPVLNKKSLTSLAMDVSGDESSKELPQGLDATTEEEYASQSKLLQEFTSIPNIEKAWILKSDNENTSQAMFAISQSNLLANKKRTHILSSHISKKNIDSVNFQWAPFPVETTGASATVPSPSGSKLLVIRNQENESPTLFEIWGPSQLQKEIHIPKSVHGSVYADGWFEGVSWDFNETLIAYVAEEPSPAKPIFDGLGYQKGGSAKDCGSWQGQGDWEEDWGETYAGKRQPALFVVDINSGGVHHVKGISKSLSVGQVIWAPTTKASDRYLVFVGWSSDFGLRKDTRKLGIKYCYNRSCGLYAIKAPLHKSGVDILQKEDDRAQDLTGVIKLTEGISSAFFPRFSPDGHSLVFLSAKSAVDSGAHWATNSLHKIDWPTDGIPCSATNIIDVVPVVMYAEDGCFPGLYCSSLLSEPWLSDGRTMILSSYWGSTEVILSVDVLSGGVARISPSDSFSSWVVLALDGDNILAVSSTPIDPPQVKYGFYGMSNKAVASFGWGWLDVSSPITRYSEKISSLLAPLQFDVLKIPIGEAPENLTKGAKKPFEAIFVSSKSNKKNACDPLIVFLHGGPHAVSLTSFSKNLAFLSSLGYSLLMVNYRGSLGFGEEALQSLPGKVGFQDVNDVLKAIDHVVEMGLADPSKVVVMGGSHGGFLTTHLIGQAPDRFLAAVARNPVCNLELMVGTTDIPDWCYVETYGSEGKTYFKEAPSMEHLHLFYNKSPISHISKVKTPTLFLLGVQDLRVPVSNGLQYARALKENGVDVKIILFPNDIHAINRPQSDFESFLNIGVWFKKYLK